MLWPTSVLLLFASVVLEGCGDDASAQDAGLLDSGDHDDEDAGTPLGCEEADIEHSYRLADIAKEFSCTADADCVLVDPVLQCTDAGTSIDDCPYAISRDKVSEFEQSILELHAELCPRIVPGCHAVGDCPSSTVVCIDKTCTQQYEEP